MVAAGRPAPRLEFHQPHADRQPATRRDHDCRIQGVAGTRTASPQGRAWYPGRRRAAPVARPVWRSCTGREPWGGFRGWGSRTGGPVYLCVGRRPDRWIPGAGPELPLWPGGGLPPGLWDALTWLARREGFGVGRAPCGPSDSVTNWSGRRIVIRSGLDGSEAAMALLHELGHVLAHDGLSLVTGTSTAGCRGVRKVEADSVAFTVATRLGVDTSAYSWPYVASWAGRDPRARPEETIRASGERVTVAVGTIAAHLDVILFAAPSSEAVPASALTVDAARGYEAVPEHAGHGAHPGRYNWPGRRDLMGGGPGSSSD